MKKVFVSLNKFVMKLIAMGTPSCEVITHKISESLDHPLSRKDRLMIRLHTYSCIFCARYRQQLLVLHEAMNRYAVQYPQTEDIGLSEETKEQIKEKLKKENL